MPLTLRPRLQGVAFLAVLVLALAGVAVCIELVGSHRDTYAGAVNEGLFCGGAGRLNCADVSAHPSSWLLGVPVAAWGLVYFTVMAVLGLALIVHRGPERKAVAAAALALVAIGLAFDLYLAARMVFSIGSICPLCVASYGINLLLLATLVAVMRAAPEPLDWRTLIPRFGAGEPARDETYYRELFKLGSGVLVVLLAGLALAWSLVPLQEIQRYGREQLADLLERIRSQPPAVDLARLGDQPARGSATPVVDLVLAGDFRCNLCRGLAQEADRLVREHPDDVRIRFVNSPLDKECNPRLQLALHPGACWLAEAGECAHEQGRFWEYHALLYSRMRPSAVSPEAVRERMAGLGLDVGRWQGCLDAGRGRDAVRADIAFLDSLGITVTPSTIINGHVKPGTLFPWMLRDLVATLLEDARRERNARP